MSRTDTGLREEAQRAAKLLAEAGGRWRPDLSLREVGTVLSVAQGTAQVGGLPGVRAEELVQFPNGVSGFAFNLDEDEVGVILLGESRLLAAGDEVRRTGRWKPG